MDRIHYCNVLKLNCSTGLLRNVPHNVFGNKTIQRNKFKRNVGYYIVTTGSLPKQCKEKYTNAG